MSVLVDKNTRLLVQGITGSAGALHTRQCMDYGTNVVAGVTPGKGGQMFDGKVPVFDTVWEARQKTNCNVSMIFVPAAAAADSILEAVDAGVELVVCITEGIPVMDMMRVKAQMNGSKSRLIGPNCPGIITPGACKIGIMPGYIHKPGSIGVICEMYAISSATGKIISALLACCTRLPLRSGSAGNCRKIGLSSVCSWRQRL